MSRRAGRFRAPVMLTLGTLVVWLAVWAIGSRAGWRPEPWRLLAALAVAAALLWLLGAVAVSGVSPLPPAHLRVTPSSPVGEDTRLLRHQMHLEDAAADPPSCRPVVSDLVHLARERLRLRHGSPDADPDRVGEQRIGHHLAAVMNERPADRTQLSSRHLTTLVDELEAL